MYKEFVPSLLFSFIIVILGSQVSSKSNKNDKNTFQPLSYEEAGKKADSVLALMTLDEKISLIGGDKSFFIRALPRLHLSEVYMTDATQGVHIRGQFRDINLSDYQPQKSTAFPCPILLASTWNVQLAYRYAEAIGEECRAAGIGILLGPGLNNYRHSQCGRNFEYFGEDPLLRAQIIAEYVKGVQSTGTIATLKHFLANNTDFYRRKSNSIIDERTLHEIYLPPFKAGIDGGAKAVMTAYNLFNGEWCGQSETVINDILRKQLGFKWLVMTDWWSVYDGEKLARSGQDLEMPMTIALREAQNLLNEGKVRMSDIDRMVKSILRTHFAMKLNDRKKDFTTAVNFAEHESIALQTAREGIILLKNDHNLLPLRNNIKTILLTGEYVEELARGGGSAAVQGYNNKLMLDEFRKEFGEKINYVKNPDADQIKSADVVLCNVGTSDNEGWDRPFALPPEQEKKVLDCVNNNPHTIVLVTSGSGIRMTDWDDKAEAIVYAWYGGQTGNQALAEIIAGKINPSGKLPLTIEKEFEDSPGYGYLPDNEQLYTGEHAEEEKVHPVYDIIYKEGIFVGYRWYEHQNIKPLYPFGHGLSYTTFKYSNLMVSPKKFRENDTVTVTFTLKNTGKLNGLETVQVYIQDEECSVPRPLKELKGFEKIYLEAGQTETIKLNLDKKDFSFWNPGTKGWFAEKGKFIIYIGSSSADIRLRQKIELI